MWRFWNNFQRAFRHNVFAPRSSVGVCVQEEQEAGDKSVCPFSGRRKSSQQLEFDHQRECCNNTIVNRLFVRRTSNGQKDCGQNDNTYSSTGHEEHQQWWKTCQHDLLRLLHGTNRMFEAITLTLGSSWLWGTDEDRRRRKTRLLYRILFALPSIDGSVTGSNVLSGNSQCPVPAPQPQLAIKDAAGAAHDAEINSAESLDTVLQEFQIMCEEYTAQNESILGLEAAKKGDMSAAVEHLHTACSLGNPSACFNLGLCYETGSGTAPDANKAMHYYNMAVKSGHTLASYNLGLMYLSSAEGICNNPPSTSQYSTCSDKQRGLDLLEKAAMGGLVEAQTYLGLHHIRENEDPVAAVPYFRAAAKQNDSEAQYFLAMCYEQGLGVDVNECWAAQLYSQAAATGHEMALYNLAVFNEHGLGGIPENLQSAKELYMKAAKLGSEEAKQRLEEMETTHQTLHSKKETVGSDCPNLYPDRGKTAIPTGRPGRPLSPSASFPVLSDRFFTDLPAQHGKTHPATSWDSRFEDVQKQNLDIENTKDGCLRINFYLGDSGICESESIDGCYELGEKSGWPELLSVRSVDNSELDSGEESLPSPSVKSFHKSYTYPNLSLVACTN